MRTEATWKSGCRNNARPHRTRLQTDDGRFNDTWDGENRVTRFERVSGAPAAAQVRVDLDYDSQSRRIQKVVSTNNGSLWIGASTNRYLYDGWNLVAVLDHANNLVQSFSWGSDLSGSPQGAGGVGGLLSMTVASGTLAGTYFYAHDGNGNVLAAVNAADGSLAARYDYGPFGEPIRASGPLAQANPFQFSTKFNDPETGLLYYGYRYYDPIIGSWPNRDPIEERGGFNMYGYCDGYPIGRIDILGLAGGNDVPTTVTCDFCSGPRFGDQVQIIRHSEHHEWKNAGYLPPKDNGVYIGGQKIIDLPDNPFGGRTVNVVTWLHLFVKCKVPTNLYTLKGVRIVAWGGAHDPDPNKITAECIYSCNLNPSKISTAPPKEAKRVRQTQPGYPGDWPGDPVERPN